MMYLETILTIAKVLSILLLALLAPFVIYEYFTGQSKEDEKRETWEKMDTGISYNLMFYILFPILILVAMVSHFILKIMQL